MTPTTDRPSVLFMGSMYAGWKTRFMDLRAHTQHDQRIRSSYHGVSGWKEQGLIERIPLVPRGLKGRARAVVEGAAFARLPRPDATWTSVYSGLMPYLWAQSGPFRRALVLDLDDTAAIRDENSHVYWGRPPHTGARKALLSVQERWLFRGVTLFTPLSEWTADSLRASGIDESRIRVSPPGIDVDAWTARPDGDSAPTDRPVRLVFVGQDFHRKGGDLLVEAVRGPLAGRCELDIVTSSEAGLQPSPGVRVHYPPPQHNSPYIRDLYAQADVFAMPSRAEHFGFSTIEAMASGLPVMIGDVGAGREIVGDGSVGWAVPPTPQGVVDGLATVVAAADRLPAMGRAARRVAEQRYSAARNHGRVVDTILEAIELERASRGHTTRRVRLDEVRRLGDE